MSNKEVKKSSSAEEIERDLRWLEPSVIEDSLPQLINDTEDKVEKMVRRWIKDGRDRIFFVGCGGSLVPGMLGKYLLDEYSNIYCDTYTGFEFITRAPRAVNKKSAVILISHSGKYEEILGSVDLAKMRGATTLAITGDEKSEVVERTDDCLVYKSKVVTISKQVMTYIICGNIMKMDGEPKGDHLLSDLKTVPSKLARVRDETRGKGKALAKEFKDARIFYVLAAGPLYSVAYLFSVSTLMEGLWTDACPIHAGEFRHGPYEIVEKDTPLVFLLGTDDSRPVVERALNFSKKYGAKVAVFDSKEYPPMDDALTPMSCTIALQWFAHYLSVERLHPLTTRRYMGVVSY